MDIEKLNEEDCRITLDPLDISQGKVNLDIFIDSRESLNNTTYILRAIKFIASMPTKSCEIMMSLNLANEIKHIINFKK